MPKAKKTEVVIDTDMDKSKIDLENINTNKKKSKKIKEVVDDSKLSKPKEDKKSKPKEQKDMTDKELKKELKNKESELNKVKKLLVKMKEIID